MTLDDLLMLFIGAGMQQPYLDAVKVGYLAGQLNARAAYEKPCKDAAAYVANSQAKVQQ